MYRLRYGSYVCRHFSELQAEDIDVNTTWVEDAEIPVVNTCIANLGNVCFGFNYHELRSTLISYDVDYHVLLRNIGSYHLGQEVRLEICLNLSPGVNITHHANNVYCSLGAPCTGGYHAYLEIFTYNVVLRTWNVHSYYVIDTDNQQHCWYVSILFTELWWNYANTMGLQYGATYDEWLNTIDPTKLLLQHHGNVATAANAAHNLLQISTEELTEFLTCLYQEGNVKGWWFNNDILLLEDGLPASPSIKHHRRLWNIYNYTCGKYYFNPRSGVYTGKIDIIYQDAAGTLLANFTGMVKVDNWYLEPSGHEAAELEQRYRLFQALQQAPAMFT